MSDLRSFLQLAHDKSHVSLLCAEPELLSRAISERFLEAQNGTFVLTKLGEKELKKKPKVQLPLLTHSEIQTFQRCPREHHFRYRLRRRPKTESHALRFGSIFDDTLQTWWSVGPLHGREAANARLDELAKTSPLNAFDIEKARALLFVYDARWGNEPYEILRVQPTFRQPIMNPITGRRSKKFDLGGKLDVLVRDIRTGEIVIVETKTTVSDIKPEASYWHTISVMDPQVSTYYSGARTILRGMGLKEDPARCVYDVIRKPGIKPLKATPVEKREYLKKDPTKLKSSQREVDETVDEYADRAMEDILGQIPQTGPGFDAKLAFETARRYFGRGPIVRLESEEHDHAMNIWEAARIISEFETAKLAPQHKGSCKRFGNSLCGFLPVCSNVASIESFEIADEKHSELKEI